MRRRIGIGDRGAFGLYLGWVVFLWVNCGSLLTLLHTRNEWREGLYIEQAGLLF